MRSMTFIIPGDPVPLARARMGKFCIYDSQKHEKLVATMLINKQMAGLKMLNPPLELEVVFFMAMAKAKRKDGRPHYSRPDLDNCIKYVCDICNKTVFNDDSGIYRIVAMKVYDDKPRTVFTLKECFDDVIPKNITK
jgi:Holliday junction resolvase RusA-like endonuclease